MDQMQLSLIGALPLLAVALGLSSMLILDLAAKKPHEGLSTIVGVGTCLLAWALSAATWFSQDLVFHKQLAIDPLTFVFYTIILAGTLFSLLLNSRQMEAQRVRPAVEIDVLTLCSTFGAMVMVSANHLLVLFLGFEILSISVYVLTGAAKHEKASSEGSLKYFLLGAFSSAFLLYGMTLVFGATGSMLLTEIRVAAATSVGSSPLFLAGVALILFGFAFKIGLVPFHFWAPDAYQGAPVSITTYMAAVVKAAAFGSLLRMLAGGFAPVTAEWAGALALLAGVTMTVGNILALRQKSVKRLLAYSSIAHAGYIMLGLVAGDSGGFEASIFYVAVYTFMTVASFGVVLLVTGGTQAQYLEDSVESYRGLGWRSPLLGLAMTIALLSLGGLPPFAGFFAKLYVFAAAVKAGYLGLVILAALNSVVSLYYYLSLIVVMYFSDGKEPVLVEKRAVPLGSQAAIALSVAIIILVGVFSQRALTASRTAVHSVSHPIPAYSLGLYEDRGSKLVPFVQRTK